MRGKFLPLLLVSIALIPTDLRAETFPAQGVELRSLFAHGQGPDAYFSALGGRARVALEATPNGAATVELPFGLGTEACRLWLMSGTDGTNQVSWATPGVEVCLAASGVDGATLDAWLAGGVGPAPTLSFLMGPDPTSPANRWLNVAEVKATLLIQDCGPAPSHRFYGTLTIPAASLTVERQLLPNNEPWLRLNANKLVLGQIDQKAWTDVIRSCGNPGAPPFPVVGFSDRLVARSDRLNPSGAAAYLSLEEARTALEDLVRQGVIERITAMTVVAPIEESERALQLTQPADAIKSVGVATTQAGQVIPSDSLPAVIAPLSIAAADFALSVFGDSAVLPFPECVKTGKCLPVVLFVDASAPPAGADGSVKRPFASILDALDAGAKTGACALILMVRPGVYSEPLVITRHTRIFGTDAGRPRIVGPIVQTGPYELTLSQVDLFKTPDIALTVSNHCAVTTLRSVLVSAAVGNGILQDGGTLTVEGLEVLGTQARGGKALLDGRGVLITGGVHAFMSDVTLQDNEGGALLVDGSDTKVFLRLALIERNHLSPSLVRRDVTLEEIFAEGGALHVRNRALLLGEWLYIADNENTGVLVSNAQAHLQGTTIYRTIDAPLPGGVDGTFLLTSNFSVNAGLAEMTHFTSSYSGFVGVHFFQSIGHLSHGRVSNNEVGASVFQSPLPLECLQDDVRYIDNGFPLTGDRYELPTLLPFDPDGSPGGPPPPPPCPSVPFVCAWCTP